MTFWGFKTFYDICAYFFSAAFIFNHINSKRNMIGVRIHLKFLGQPEVCVLLVTYTDAIHSHAITFWRVFKKRTQMTAFSFIGYLLAFAGTHLCIATLWSLILQ